MEAAETGNVVAMALDLIRVLAESGVLSEADIEDLSADDWLRAARIVHARRTDAGNPPKRKAHVPSEATRAAVVAILRDRAEHPDPFEGFPKQGG